MTFELVIRGATVHTGDAAPARPADVGVAGGLIVAVEPSLDGPAADVVDGTGLLLCPGFVDLHAHTALASFHDPCLVPKIGQGFTTEVINPDGLAPAPVDPARVEERRSYLQPLEGPGPDTWTWSTVEEYLDALDATRPATSLVPSIGHGAVRDLVLGGDRVAPTPEQLRELCRHVRLGLEAGSRMLSFGLVYLPAAYAATDELVAVAREAAAVGAPLVPHVRNEGAGVLDAVAEMIGVAREVGAPLHLSHLKALADESLVEPLLGLLEEASRDLDLTYDQYPYGAGSTLLAGVLPAWAQEGGASATLARCADRAARERIRDDIAAGVPGWENLLGTLGPERIEIADAAAPNDHVVGRTLASLADELGVHHVDAVLDLLAGSALDVTMVLHYASEEAVRTVAAHPLQLVGSDGIFGARPHPRLYATAPRFLGRFALRDGLLPVEEAIARLTSRAADRIGLSDRGRVAAGKRADLVLLDPLAFVDTATYESPAQAPPGVEGVWVAGRRVWRDGAPTGERPGGVVR
ncbi:MAG: amidohydrolase family protein [Thermoleophilia bacterium]|nr:amidohydrolase family protein [Thermoleophilia bacterium]